MAIPPDSASDELLELAEPVAVELPVAVEPEALDVEELVEFEEELVFEDRSAKPTRSSSKSNTAYTFFKKTSPRSQMSSPNKS